MADRWTRDGRTVTIEADANDCIAVTAEAMELLLTQAGFERAVA